MVEIPTKNAAAYRNVFDRLNGLAKKYNDAPGVDLNPSPDQFALSSVSKAMYSNGDKTTYQAQLTNGEVTRLEVEVTAGERRPAYKANLTLEQTATGLQGKESLHGRNGLTERSFTIEGDKVTTLSENRTQTPYQTPATTPENSRPGQELSMVTSQLEYLLGPSF